MIDRITIEKIMDAANIVDVVGDFVTLKRAGANYKGLCPFHDDRTPSFMVSPAKNYCKCFACGKGGNPVTFLMEKEQISYPDALRWLAKKYGITIEEKQLTAEEKASRTERESLFIINEWVHKWFMDQMNNTADGRAIGLAYFRSRGFRDDIIEKFQLGYCPSQRDACSKAALKAGFQEKFLVSDPDQEGIAHGVGISIKRDNGTLYDRFSGRVIFPIFTVAGKVVGFGGRVLDAATKGVSVKYQNSPESIIYHKKSELYGLFQAKQAIVKQDCVFMVEGYTDVMAMHQNGVENVVSSSGTALTHEQIRLIRRLTNNIVVLYDGDAAGIKASQRGIDMLLREGMNVKLLLLPDGQDPDEFGRTHTPEEYQEYMKSNQIDFIRFKTNLLMEEAKGDPIAMSKLVNNIVQSIAIVPDDITRTFYIRETAQMMQLKEALITDAVNKQVKLNVEQWRKEKEREESRAQYAAKNNSAAAPQGAATTQPDNAGTQQEGYAGAQQDEYTDYIEEAIPSVNDIPIQQQMQSTNAQDEARERLIIQTILKHGEAIICNIEEEDGSLRPLTVLEFVYYSLAEENIILSTPLYQRVLQIGFEHIHDNGFCAERFFLNHPEPEINRMAGDLCVEREQLSKFHTRGNENGEEMDYEELMNLVGHVLTDYKLNLVKNQKQMLMQQMRDPEVLKDRTRCRALMEELQAIKVKESELAKACGDRVIV